MKVASLSLRDYTDDLVAFVNSLDSPPLLIGHSMGGLLAQAHGDAATYAQFRDRYRDVAKTLGFEAHIALAEAMP